MLRKTESNSGNEYEIGYCKNVSQGSLSRIVLLVHGNLGKGVNYDREPVERG